MSARLRLRNRRKSVTAEPPFRFEPLAVDPPTFNASCAKLALRRVTGVRLGRVTRFWKIARQSVDIA